MCRIHGGLVAASGNKRETDSGAIFIEPHKADRAATEQEERREGRGGKRNGREERERRKGERERKKGEQGGRRKRSKRGEEGRWEMREEAERTEEPFIVSIDNSRRQSETASEQSAATVRLRPRRRAGCLLPLLSCRPSCPEAAHLRPPPPPAAAELRRPPSASDTGRWDCG
jgi:hypothetical protein